MMQINWRKFSPNVPLLQFPCCPYEL